MISPQITHPTISQFFPQIFPKNNQKLSIFPSLIQQENQHFIHISTFYPYNLERNVQKVQQEYVGKMLMHIIELLIIHHIWLRVGAMWGKC